MTVTKKKTNKPTTTAKQIKKQHVRDLDNIYILRNILRNVRHIKKSQLDKEKRERLRY